MTAGRYDVVQLTDLRHGGTVGTLTAQARVARRAGYRTALVPVHSPLSSRVRPGAEMLALARTQDVDVVLPTTQAPVRTRLLVVRHPAVLTVPTALAAVAADRVLVLARPPVTEAETGAPLYAVDDLDRLLTERFGTAVEWALPFPGGELPGRVLQGATQAAWPDTVDTTAWPGARHHSGRPVPVVGRHGRGLPWPTTVRDLDRAYPMDGRLPVMVAGDVGGVRSLLGSVPTAWTRTPHDPTALPGFLAQVDVAVHLGAPGVLDPAVVRPVLESVAAGVPTLVDPAYRDLFGDVAGYATPAEVEQTVRELHADPAAYEERSRAGFAALEERFGPEVHLRALRERLGEPAGPTVAAGAPSGGATPRPSGTAPALPASRPRVLLVSSNGAGMGHLTRLLAYARRLGERADVAFLSMSQAVPVVGQWGFPYDYLPSAGTTGMPSRVWHRLYYERAVALIDHYRPDVVAFDGTYPYAATSRIRAARPGPRWVWSRRGMWREEVPGVQLQWAGWFDAVLEPGDLAAAYDRGATASAPAHRVGPVTLLDREEAQSRADARSALGLPADGPLALISLGAGNINDTGDDTGAAIAALRRLGVGICLTRTPIGLGDAAAQDVHVVQDYPLARRYAAFDLVVSASGYNSFHELLRFGVPTLFVPNAQTSLDDQVSRAHFAADQGWAHQLGSVTVAEAEPLLADLLARGAEMVAGAVHADPGNGAAAAADFLLDVAAGREAGAGTTPHTVGTAS